MDRRRHWSEGFLHALAATVCLVAFIIEDPWMIRDGCHVCELVQAYPYFLLTPVCAAAGARGQLAVSACVEMVRGGRRDFPASSRNPPICVVVG